MQPVNIPLLILAGSLRMIAAYTVWLFLTIKAQNQNADNKFTKRYNFCYPPAVSDAGLLTSGNTLMLNFIVPRMRHYNCTLRHITELQGNPGLLLINFCGDTLTKTPNRTEQHKASQTRS